MLEYLKNCPNVELSHIVSQPDRASGRRKILKPTAVSNWALAQNIPLLRPTKPDEHLAKTLGTCDLILVMAYGHILRNYILSLPKFGIFNFHASILPKYRGASPVETALACGEQVTGISLMEIVPQMDAGDVIDTEIVQISPKDYASDLYLKLSKCCVALLARQLPNLIAKKIIKQPQNSKLATYTRKITKQDGQIDFSLPAVEIFNRIRGFHEHVGTFIKLNGTTLNIGKCQPYETTTQFPQIGQILSIEKDGLLVSTSAGTLKIFELQRPGGKLLNIRDFINGFHLKIGDTFESARSTNIISSEPFPWKKSD